MGFWGYIIISVLTVLILYNLYLFFQWVSSDKITMKEKIYGIIIIFLIVEFGQSVIPALRNYRGDDYGGFGDDTFIYVGLFYFLMIIFAGFYFKARRETIKNKTDIK